MALMSASPRSIHTCVRRLEDAPVLTKEGLSPYAVVVAVDRSHDELVELNRACREAGCRLVACDSRRAWPDILRLW